MQMASLTTAVTAVLLLMPASAAAPADTPAELHALYAEYRDSRAPEVRDGVPDYTPAGMAEQREGLRRLQARLAAIDTAGWSVADRVDYLVVKAEMNALEFDHRVLRPWVRDPAFYIVISFQFGPKMYGARGLPSLDDGPLSAEGAAEVGDRLRTFRPILEQARGNLTEPAADLTLLGIRSKDREEAELVEWMADARTHHPELVPPAEDALAAIREFRAWLQEIHPGLTRPSGIGREDYTWYMQNVMLLPYTWQELHTIASREYERSIALMALEEHKNRDLPPIPVARNRAETSALRLEAQTTIRDFIRRERVLSERHLRFLAEPRGLPGGDGPNRLDPLEPRDYFAEVEFRDPVPLIPHEYAGHAPDAVRRREDERPIRGQSRLYFVDGTRAEALATGMEQMLAHLGILDDRPRSEELQHNLLAFRAARALSDLKMHDNEITLLEGFQYNVDWTPKGWLPEDSPTMWHDIELYMRQPGYGVGYLIGLVQIEQLIADRYAQLGDDFDLTEFMDDFLDRGMVPISLIRWEMTGIDDHVRDIR